MVTQASLVIGRIFSRSNDPTIDDPMLAFFLSALDVRVKVAEIGLTADSYQAKLLSEVKERLANFGQFSQSQSRFSSDAAWTEAYRLERILALLEPAQTLITELHRRSDEAIAEGVPAAARLKAALAAVEAKAIDATQSPPAIKSGGEPLLRALLLDMLEELHWTLQRKFYARPIQKAATSRIVALGIVSFILFIFPYAYLYMNLYPDSRLPIDSWSWLPLYTALTGGLFGAFFSRLIFIQTHSDLLTLGEIKNARDTSSILLRGAVGMCGAVVAYFFCSQGSSRGSFSRIFHNSGFFKCNIPSQSSVMPMRQRPFVWFFQIQL